MDNGKHKVYTTNQRPSKKQIATFKEYSEKGYCNELIAMLTGYRKPTIDNYVTETTHSAKAWDNVKSYAMVQFAKAAEANAKDKDEAIDRQIQALKVRISELEALKPQPVANVEVTMKYEAKMAAKGPRTMKLFNKALPIMQELFSDGQWHTSKEVDDILKDCGYKGLNCRSRCLRSIFQSKIVFGHHKYMVPKAA